jgi:antitoxin VapB
MQPSNQVQTAKLFMNGQSQSVRLPKEFRFPGQKEVVIQRMGEMVVLYPADRREEIFFSSFGAAGEDFMSDYRGCEGMPEDIRDTL